MCIWGTYVNAACLCEEEDLPEPDLDKLLIERKVRIPRGICPYKRVPADPNARERCANQQRTLRVVRRMTTFCKTCSLIAYKYTWLATENCTMFAPKTAPTLRRVVDAQDVMVRIDVGIRAQTAVKRKIDADGHLK